MYFCVFCAFNNFHGHLALAKGYDLIMDIRFERIVVFVANSLLSGISVISTVIACRLSKHSLLHASLTLRSNIHYYIYIDFISLPIFLGLRRRLILLSIWMVCQHLWN